MKVTANTEEPTNEELMLSEDDIISGLMAAASGIKEDTATIKIERNGKILFKFRVHGFSEDQIKEIREHNCTYRKNNMGVRILDDFNDTRFSSEIIYNATITEDKQKLWDNPTVKKNLNCLSGIDIIDSVLKAGEKDAIYNVIQKISGYSIGEDIAVKETKKTQLLKN